MRTVHAKQSYLLISENLKCFFYHFEFQAEVSHLYLMFLFECQHDQCFNADSQRENTLQLMDLKLKMRPNGRTPKGF